MPANSGTSTLSSLSRPRDDSIWYCALVTISPRRTMTSPLTRMTVSTASRAFSRFCSVASSSMSMLGCTHSRISSVAAPTSGGV